MNYIKWSVKKLAIALALIICIGVGAGALLSMSGNEHTVKADGSYITTVQASQETDADALIDFYKEKVDKLNRQCNILLLICVLLLVALIITRLIQPHQSIYEIEKLEKKNNKKDNKPDSAESDKGTDFEEAVNSMAEEVYTVQKEVGEDIRDISDSFM